MLTSLLAVALVPKVQVLILTETAGFRHDSIPAGVKMFQELGKDLGIGITEAKDSSALLDPKLDQYSAVVFLSTTGDLCTDEEQAAFEKYIQQGGGFLGIHAAADTEYDWPFYGKLVGGYFKQHPAVQEATILVQDKKHPATKMLPSRWTRTDEWYDYRALPASNVKILASLDSTSYKGSVMGTTHPIIWCHDQGKGRAFYTGLGHTTESYQEPLFVQHVTGALIWVCRLSD